MSRENKRARSLFWHAAALVVPLVAVSTLTFSLQHGRAKETLDDPNPAVRAATLRATGWQGHVDLLTRALQDENEDVRLLAAMKLQSRREEAGSSVKALIALLRDKHKGVRREAIEALSAIGAPAVPALLETLADPDPSIRAGAIAGLGDVGRPKDERKRSPQELALVIPALEKLRKDEDPTVGKKATRLLRYLRQEPRDDE